MLEIKRNININQIEEFCKLINNKDAISTSLLLDLPISTSIQPKEQYSPGVVISLIQMFSTWCRINNSEGKILTKFNSDRFINIFENNIIQYPELLCLFAMNNFANIYDKKNPFNEIKLNSIEVLKQYEELENIIKIIRDHSKYSSFNSDGKDTPLFVNPEEEKQNELIKQSLSNYKKLLQKHKKNFIESDTTALYFGCFDRKLKYEYPSYFYTNNKFNTNVHDEFSDFIKQFLSLTKIYKKTELIKKAVYKDIATVLYELIENTEKWAKRSSNNSLQLDPNIRGAYLCLNLINNEDLINPQNAISDYINRFKIESFQKRRVLDLYLYNEHQKSQEEEFIEEEQSLKMGILEISVVDSGPGLVKRNSEGIDVLEMSFIDEIVYFKKSFQEHFTSDMTSEGEGRGMGLPSVINAIKAKGFIKIRTGRISAYRNFFDDPLTNDEKNKNSINFFDWEGKPGGFTCMSKVEGTSITILYPFALNIS